jgi:hypothetical protein
MGRFSFPLFAKSLKALHSGIPLRGAKRGLLLFINVLHIFPTETRTPLWGWRQWRSENTELRLDAWDHATTADGHNSAA